MIQTDKYPAVLRLLHWLIALFIICLLAVGLYMTSLSKDDPLRGTLYGLHKSFGITVLALAFIRLPLRLMLLVPPLPIIIPKIERTLAQLGHAALYLFMFLMPLSGWVMSNSFGLGVHWFGVTLPRIVGVDRDRGALASDIHSFAAYALIGMIVLHVGAVILHYWQHRVNLVKRML